MIDFNENKYKIIENFLDGQSLNLISQYIQNSLKRFPENIQPKDGDVYTINEKSWYRDPLIDVLHINSLPDIEAATGLSLYPTYTFVRIYKSGDVLLPHADRPACEISVTCNITTEGNIWPLYMKSPGREPVMHYLEPGSACVYKGCEVTHWRDEAPETSEILQVMLHYVNKNGPYADHRFDRC
jgi:hypothetical protein